MPDEPDLEQLNVVEYKRTWSASSFLNRSIAIGLILGYVEITSLILNYHCVTNFNHFFAAIGVLVLIVESVCAVNYIRIDKSGIEVHRPFRKKYIKWDHVQDVIVKMKRRQVFKCILIGKHGNLSVPILKNERVLLVALASIKQHLKRTGKQNKIPFVGETQDLWWQAPALLPNETEWTNEHKLNWRLFYKLLWFSGSCFIIFMIISVLFNFPYTAATIKELTIGLGTVYIIFWISLRRMRTIARFAKVNDDGIEVETGFGRWKVPWSNICYSGWDPYGLVLRSTSLKSAIYLPEQSNSSILLLVIIKKLRSIDDHKWIAIPETLQRYSVSKLQGEQKPKFNWQTEN